MSNAPIELPSLLIVKVLCNDSNYRYILLNIGKKVNATGKKIYKANIVKNSKYILGRGKIYEDGLEMPGWIYTFERENGKKVVESKISRTKRYIICDTPLNQRSGEYEYYWTDKKIIPEYTIINANTVLGSDIYSIVYKGQDEEQIWHFDIQKIERGQPNDRIQEIQRIEQESLESIHIEPIRVESTRIAIDEKEIEKVKTIPEHIYRIYVEQAIQKGEECPITLEKLERETVACTPCGHLFRKEALERTLKETNKCPTCRAKARPEDIQTMK